MPVVKVMAWAARYNTGLLIKLTPKGVVFSLLFLRLWLLKGHLAASSRVCVELLPEEVESLTAAAMSHCGCVTYQEACYLVLSAASVCGFVHQEAKAELRLPCQHRFIAC